MVYLLKMVIFHSYVSLPEGIQVIDPSCDISWEIMVSGHWPERPLQDLCAGAQLRSLSLFKSVVGSTWHDWMILHDFVWGEATGKMTWWHDLVISCDIYTFGLPLWADPHLLACVLHPFCCPSRPNNTYIYTHVWYWWYWFILPHSHKKENPTWYGLGDFLYNVAHVLWTWCFRQWMMVHRTRLI